MLEEGVKLLQIKQDDKSDCFAEAALSVALGVISTVTGRAMDAGLIEMGIFGICKLIDKAKVASMKHVYALVTVINRINTGDDAVKFLNCINSS